MSVESPCTGSERHRHYNIEKGAYVWHSHRHSCQSDEYNNLHHHRPQDHQEFTYAELAHDQYYDPPEMPRSLSADERAIVYPGESTDKS